MLKKRTFKNVIRELVSDYASQKFSVWGKNLEFLEEDRFKRAVETIRSAYRKEYPDDNVYDRRWTLHILFWAAQNGLAIEGDFVECGVDKGESSLAICDYLGFERINKKFYLCDTFSGMPTDRLEGKELNYALKSNKDSYKDTYSSVKNMFSKYDNVEVVQGIVPDSLHDLDIEKVSYLSIDMNNAIAESTAIRHFWPKLSPAAIIVLDDYGWKAFGLQKKAVDSLAAEFGVPVVTLPTGQGLIVKPS